MGSVMGGGEGEGEGVPFMLYLTKREGSRCASLAKTVKGPEKERGVYS